MAKPTPSKNRRGSRTGGVLDLGNGSPVKKIAQTDDDYDYYGDYAAAARGAELAALAGARGGSGGGGDGGRSENDGPDGRPGSAPPAASLEVHYR